MFSHVTIGSDDIERAGAFYDAVLGALGHRRFHEMEGGIGYGEESGDQVWVVNPLDGKPACVGNGMMIALLAPDRPSVDKAYMEAMAQGGTSEGEPGLRPHYHADYYAAYFRDPQGNKLCAVCHRAPS